MEAEATTHSANKIISWGLTTLLLTAFLGLGNNAAGQPDPDFRIASRALTFQEIHDYDLPEGTQRSRGIFTVGIGQPVYLEALAKEGIVVTDVSWALIDKPGTSSAVLEPSILGTVEEVPIYAPGDRDFYTLEDRMTLIPDVRTDLLHTYTVEVTFTYETAGASAEGDTAQVVLTQDITAAGYVGVGILGTPTGFSGGECVLCHSGSLVFPERLNKVEPWLETGHASFLVEALDGIKSSHYEEDCIKCHTVGFDGAPLADNGGFDDVNAGLDTPWEFPDTLEDGNWDALPQELKKLSNIQCESCHGPGGEHFGDPAKTSISLDAGDCAYCHDEDPYHTRPQEWANSKHAIATRYPTGSDSRKSCVVCHSGVGFIQRIKDDIDITQSGYQNLVDESRWNAITCQVCHDPHDATNEHQLRRVGVVTLYDGTVITKGGTGKLCMNCHIARRDGEDYAATQNGSGHFGPHHGPQTDMLVGANAVEYGLDMPSSGHINAVSDACATCHMQPLSPFDPNKEIVGGHTFKPAVHIEGAGIESEGEEIELTGACAACHGPIAGFDFAQEDYDGDGVVEGVRTEIHGLLGALGMYLPPIGQPDVNHDSTGFDRPSLKAIYNYLFVEEDGSFGIHNTSYSVAILKASIANMEAWFEDQKDSDKDGLDDAWEIEFFGSIGTQGADDDSDGDGISNLLEQKIGTDPSEADTDGDTYSDYSEIVTGSDPDDINDVPEMVGTIFPAVEFEFQSQNGATYQVQVSSDLTGDNWVNYGDPIVSDGGPISAFFPTEGMIQEFYRVVKLP